MNERLFFFQDINECLTGKGTCSKDALCINTAGSYECRCKDGFVGDGFTCSGNGVTLRSLAIITRSFPGSLFFTLNHFLCQQL